MVIKRKIAAALVMNLVIAAVTLTIVLSYFFGNKDFFIHSGPESFQFFTTDSNVLNMLGAMILIPFELRVLTGRAKALPRFAVVIKYITTSSVMLTFCTVMLFLGPVFGYSLLLSDTGIFTHLISPLLAVYSFALLETDCEISFKNVLWAIVPTLVYGIIYIVQVFIIGKENGGWQDFYFFNLGGYWYMSATVMFIASVLINLLVKGLHNSTYKKFLPPEKTGAAVYEW